ncbi:MAG: 50S ribosomal protein L16 [Planctomycetes bacterium]|nr:50S ribosomal protein L16 [Planctomycetota bacterium]
MPKRVKHRKSQRGRIRGNATRGNYVAFGEFGLQALGPAWLTARQVEAARVAATHFLHREGKLFMRIFPHKPVAAKPLETRMGKGKGETEYWAAVIKPGMVLYELGGVPEDVAKQALNRAARKLPVPTRFIHRRHRV